MAARIPNGDSIEKSPTPLPEWRKEAARGDGTSHWTPRHIQTGNTRSYRRYRELLPARICVHMAPVAPRKWKKKPDRAAGRGADRGHVRRTGRPDRSDSPPVRPDRAADRGAVRTLSGRTGGCPDILAPLSDPT